MEFRPSESASDRRPRCPVWRNDDTSATKHTAAGWETCLRAGVFENLPGRASRETTSEGHRTTGLWGRTAAAFATFAVAKNPMNFREREHLTVRRSARRWGAEHYHAQVAPFENEFSDGYKRKAFFCSGRLQLRCSTLFLVCNRNGFVLGEPPEPVGLGTVAETPVFSHVSNDSREVMIYEHHRNGFRYMTIFEKTSYSFAEQFS